MIEQHIPHDILNKPPLGGWNCVPLQQFYVCKYLKYINNMLKKKMREVRIEDDMLKIYADALQNTNN